MINNLFLQILFALVLLQARLTTADLEDVAEDICGTPDCLPPPLENFCDAYEDTTAKGLCNAYCYAEDCDDFPSPACNQIKKNFVRMTGDADFPCERCPCWTDEELRNFDDETSPTSAVIGGGFTGFRRSYIRQEGVRFEVTNVLLPEPGTFCVKSSPGEFLFIRFNDEDEKIACQSSLQERLVEIGAITAESGVCPCFTADDLDFDSSSCEVDAKGDFGLKGNAFSASSRCFIGTSFGTTPFSETIVGSGTPDFPEYASDEACRALIDTKCCELGFADLRGNCPS